MLDIGCFVGHDLRRLVFDGAPSDRLYALDIVSHWDVGYSFFRDRDRFEAHFLEADIMHPNADLSKLDGQVHHLYCPCPPPMELGRSGKGLRQHVPIIKTRYDCGRLPDRQYGSRGDA